MFDVVVEGNWICLSGGEESVEEEECVMLVGEGEGCDGGIGAH